MSIQKYTDGTLAFDFATDSEKVYTIICTMGGAGYDERGVRGLLCVGHGEVRMVEEIVEHTDNNYCTAETWREVPFGV